MEGKCICVEYIISGWLARVIGMKELGEFLKNERIKKGLTLEEIQEITKIRIRYLKAIEDGDFSIMPALGH